MVWKVARQCPKHSMEHKRIPNITQSTKRLSGWHARILVTTWWAQMIRKRVSLHFNMRVALVIAAKSSWTEWIVGQILFLFVWLADGRLKGELLSFATKKLDPLQPAQEEQPATQMSVLAGVGGSSSSSVVKSQVTSPPYRWDWIAGKLFGNKMGTLWDFISCIPWTDGRTVCMPDIQWPERGEEKPLL